jgi:hypothetical protein
MSKTDYKDSPGGHPDSYILNKLFEALSTIETLEASSQLKPMYIALVRDMLAQIEQHEAAPLRNAAIRMVAWARIEGLNAGSSGCKANRDDVCGNNFSQR